MKRTLHLLARVALCVALILTLDACASRKKKYTGVSDEDMIGGVPLPDRDENVAFLGSNVDRQRFPAVHFAFDSSSVLPQDRPKLDAVAAYMERNSRAQIVIAGFTDERGTAEYNRGLGERRAQAVRNYLLQRGADDDRIQTVSYGAEMPVDAGSNESAWAKNRRAEFGILK